MKSILIIDDEREICESIQMILEYEDYNVDYSTDSISGLDKLKYGNFDALFLDIQMPGKNGFEVLEWIKEEDIHINVIMISAFSSLENAVKATKLGAFDFIEKPIEREKLLISVRNAVKQTSLTKENKFLKDEIQKDSLILGDSTAIKRILETVERVAKTEARVMVTGENGTGKELVARSIHLQSPRAEFPIVEVNCAAIPNELIESELFGHEKGSFTGASQQRIGKFEQANGGTLFLDEIGDMSLQAQAKVLRAIEDSKIERVGGNKKIDVDVRIIAATNKNLEAEIEEGNFREDLFHRLNVIPIAVPALRERKEDIPILVKHFVNIYESKNGLSEKEFTQGAIKLIQNQSFTGNVRELKNLIERILILVPDEKITENNLLPLLGSNRSVNNDFLDPADSFQEFKEKAEKAFIEKQLEINNWNISKTAEVLDIQRSHLYGKMKKYGIENKKS
ncbi:MAG: sigma-54-dependent transcriptional regulator [Rhodothermaceae bacterium]